MAVMGSCTRGCCPWDSQGKFVLVCVSLPHCIQLALQHPPSATTLPSVPVPRAPGLTRTGTLAPFCPGCQGKLTSRFVLALRSTLWVLVTAREREMGVGEVPVLVGPPQALGDQASLAVPPCSRIMPPRPRTLAHNELLHAVLQLGCAAQPLGHALQSIFPLGELGPQCRNLTL